MPSIPDASASRAQSMIPSSDPRAGAKTFGIVNGTVAPALLAALRRADDALIAQLRDLVPGIARVEQRLLRVLAQLRRQTWDRHRLAIDHHADACHPHRLVPGMLDLLDVAV